MAVLKLPPKNKWRKVVKGKDGIRRCVVCGVNIDHRGNAAKFCDKHAKLFAVEWRRKYDAKPDLIAKRKAYDKKPENVLKAKQRRNKKLYLLDLLLWRDNLSGATIDQAIDKVEKELLNKKGELPLIPKTKRGDPIPASNHAYATLRGKGKRKRKR